MVEHSVDKKKWLHLADVIHLVEVVATQPNINLTQIAIRIGVSKATVERLIEKVKVVGIMVKNTGSKRKPNYVVSDWGKLDKEKVLADMKQKCMSEEKG